MVGALTLRLFKSFTLTFIFLSFFISLPILASANTKKYEKELFNSNISIKDKENLKTSLDEFSKKYWKKATLEAEKIENSLAKKIFYFFNLERKNTPASFQELSSFINENPDWPLINHLKKNAESAMSNDLKPGVILNWFGKRDPLTTVGWMHKIKAYLEIGEVKKARKIIKNVWINKNFVRHNEKYFYKLYRRHLTIKDHEQRLDRLLWEGKNWPVRRMLWKVNSSFRLVSEARLMLRQNLGNVDKAISKVSNDQINSPGIIFERLRWRIRKGKYEESIELLSSAPKNPIYPKKWWRERSYLTRLALKKGHITRAYQLAKKHSLKEGAEFAEAEWLAGWISLRFLKEPKIALKHFNNMYHKVNYPISRARGAYWSGRAEFAMGNINKANNWFQTASKQPTAFYGQLALAWLNLNEPNTLPPEPNLVAEEISEFQKLELVKVIEILSAINNHDAIKHFLLAIADIRKTTSWKLLTARYAAKHGRIDVAITIAKKSSRSGEELIEAGYPIINLPLVKNDDSLTIETPLVLAMIRQESVFYPRARSRANARGLMQILPRTAKKIAKNLKIKYSKRQLTNNPNYNMVIGQTYLRNLIDEFDGSYVLALAGYNAGPGRARKWLKLNGSPRENYIKTIDWIEMIPFRETRNYVQRVLENLQVYRIKLGESTTQKTLKHDLIR